MLARKLVSVADRHEAPDPAGGLNADLAALRRPLGLEAAAARLNAARDRRAEIAARSRAYYAELARQPNFCRGPDAGMSALAAELQEADRGINRALGDLATEREKFGPAFSATVRPHLAAAARQVIAALDQLGAAQKVFRSAEIAAAQDGQARPHSLFFPDASGLRKRAVKMAAG